MRMRQIALMERRLPPENGGSGLMSNPGCNLLLEQHRLSRDPAPARLAARSPSIAR